MTLATSERRSRQDSLEKFMEEHGIHTIDKTTYDMESGSTIVRKGFRARKGEQTEAPSGLPRELRYKGNDSKRFL